MPLLDWLEENEDETPSIPNLYHVPIYKKVWGTFRTIAEDEEHARQQFFFSLSSEVEANTEWEGDTEYEYESCGVIERE